MTHTSKFNKKIHVKKQNKLQVERFEVVPT